MPTVTNTVLSADPVFATSASNCAVAAPDSPLSAMLGMRMPTGPPTAP